MAELDLSFSHRHTVGGQLLAKDGFHHLVGYDIANGFSFVQSITPVLSVDGKMIRRSRLLYCAARVRHQHMGLLRSEKKEKKKKKS